MKRFVLIPDSFKGTMSSAEICRIMEKEIRAHYPDAHIVSVPVADGGEGCVDAFLAAVGGEKRTAEVKGPFFDDMESFYGVIDGGKTAVIEMAACAGLPLVSDHPDPRKTTTFGAGQLMSAALESGCEKIIMGLGGSATNDGGCGAAAALGVRFFDADGKSFIPVGGTLERICRVDLSGVHPALKKADIVTMCDIDNPLFGPSGAAYVFGPQKGADPAAVEDLDRGLRVLSDVVERDTGADAAFSAGAGAAGGMGYGMTVFFGSRLMMGIEAVLDTVHFDDLVHGADYVFSGEGKIDGQSLRGKVVVGVARRAKAAGVPVIAVVGDIGDDIGEVYGQGVSAVFSTNRVAVGFEQAKLRAGSDLALTMDNLMRFLKMQEEKCSG